MSSKLLLLLLVVCAAHMGINVYGQKIRQADLSGVETEPGKPYNGIRQSVRHMDENPEYEREKGVLIRNKRDATATPGAASSAKPGDVSTPQPGGAAKAAANPGAATAASPDAAAISKPGAAAVTAKPGAAPKKPTAQGVKRREGFFVVFLALTLTLVFLSLVSIGLFVWLLIALKKVKK
ncbi:uncharacterized protein CELE_F55D12.6 [Caenorhabditis elegans]|uniref:Uncharacterized protein n=1 Tax=Caenorhabditis elegans TaxID=6239 RepID=O62264_CAEEL|nr:Uncharacterized protein CELE_F55D12.6 [Caenorhabditis elegans]CAA99863.1 Uncharacterized protein CELE_F55D12.6 [Caenorhabditis elegans]|eukprot:NP_492182.1 Uncharacterized protein CELE_F55D12.6 [Caenorhabditis elegans]